MINLAIDEKSPYTGGHCQRAPTLTMMLAEATDAIQEGPLASFHMDPEMRLQLLQSEQILDRRSCSVWDPTVACRRDPK